jgi:hypothetical protein
MGQDRERRWASMTLRTKFLFIMTFLCGFGLSLVLQSCVGIPIAVPAPGVTVGGGVTGRWQVTIAGGTVPPSMTMVLIEDSQGNVSGTAVWVWDIPPAGSVEIVVGIIGKIESGAISFAEGSVGAAIHWQGVVSDINHMSGTWEFLAEGESGTWVAVREPLIGE